MKPISFKEVKPDRASDYVNTIAKLNNWQIFSLAVPGATGDTMTIIYIVASLPLSSSHALQTQTQKMPAMQAKRLQSHGNSRL